MNAGMLHGAAALDLIAKMQDAHAQNLANASTIGYRRRAASAEAFERSLRSAAGLQLPHYREHVDFKGGELAFTGSDLDVAIEGDGFFELRTPQGMRYTKNGNFGKDAEGFLVAMDGSRVEGEGGPIQIDPLRGAVSVDETGNVRQDGHPLGRIRVVEFADPDRLQAEGGGRFRAPQDVQAKDATSSSIRPQHLDQGNVNVVDELVQMISGFRAFEAAQKSILGLDRVRSSAITNR